MTWLTVDDNFADHPKVEALSDKAFRLHVSGLCYCAKHQTDGKVVASRAARLVGYTSKALTELLGAGVWHTSPDGFEIHDFLDWNPSKADVTKRRNASKERQRKHRESRVTESVTEPVTNGVLSNPLQSTVSSPSDRDKNYLQAVGE